MNKKKVFGIIGTGAMALGLLFGAGSPTEPVSANITPEHQTDQKPVRTFVNEENGVTVSVYPADPKDRATLLKETGWKDGEVETVKGKGKTITEKLGVAVNKTAQGVTDSLVDNLGTKKVSAHTDTSGWDLIGQEYWLMYANYTKVERDTTWHSHGGDYKFRLPGHTVETLQSGFKEALGEANLYDYDPTNGDDWITAWTYYPVSIATDYVVSGMSNFRDGTNNEVEAYTTHQQSYSTKGNVLQPVSYYD